jgi:hypothetical protein
MKKIILCVGCSWTYGHGLSSDQTYPAHLQNLLNEYEVINAGHCGADINYAIFSAVRLIEEYNPCLVIFQITTFDRVTLGTDGYDNFVSDIFYDGRDDQIYYETADAEYKRVIGIAHNKKTKITHGTYISEDFLDELKVSRMKNTTAKEYKKFVSMTVENVLYSNYTHQKLYTDLFLFQQYLKFKNIKSLYFYWIHHKEKFKKNFNSELFDGSNTIDISVKEWFEKNYPNTNFYTDNGYHLSNEGNVILVNQYLHPQLVKIL